MTSIAHLIKMNQSFNVNLLTNKIVFYIGIGFLAVAFVFFAFVQNVIVYLIITFIGILLLFVNFYLNKIIFGVLYVNGVSLILIYICFPIFIFVFIMMCKDSYIKSLNLTLKQYESINVFETQIKHQMLMDRKTNESKQEEELDLEHIKMIKSLEFCSRFRNYIKFVFTYNESKSMLYDNN